MSKESSVSVTNQVNMPDSSISNTPEPPLDEKLSKLKDDVALAATSTGAVKVDATALEVLGDSLSEQQVASDFSLDPINQSEAEAAATGAGADISGTQRVEGAVSDEVDLESTIDENENSASAESAEGSEFESANDAGAVEGESEPAAAEDSTVSESKVESKDTAAANVNLQDYGRASKMNEARTIDPYKQYYKPWLESYPENVPEFVDTRPYENLDELFTVAVAAHGDHIAYSNFGSELTFNEVGELASNFAAFLQVKLGMEQGDKIAIMMPNLMQYPIVFFGALKAGLTVININPLYTPRELQLMLDSSDAKTIVVLANVAYNLQSIISQTKVKHVIVASVGDCLGFFKGMIFDTVLHFKGLVPHFDFDDMITLRAALRRGGRYLNQFVKPQIDYDDIALLQFTGGTTGRSKGAMLSHGNLIANVAQALGVYGSQLRGTQETILTVIPLYHIFALTVNLILMFDIGAKNILITDPRDIKAFVKTLQQHPEISALTGVNTLFNLFVNHREFKDIEWKNLHLVIGGGAAVQSGVEQRFFEKTGLHILEGYGLTECSPLCAVCPYTTDHYTGSIGLIVPSTIARIVDVNGEEIHDLERTGELEIKGPQVMHGYYKCEAEINENAFDDGYLRTGDIAKWIEGGYIKLIDRLKDMILVSGFNVFPSEIEDVVSRFNRVLECAVIGIPSEKTGEAVKMFVVKKDQSLTEAEVKNYCRAYLTPYKVPSVIEFVSSLPKSGLGKVLRRKLRENNFSMDTPQSSSSATTATSANAAQITAARSTWMKDEQTSHIGALGSAYTERISSEQKDEASSANTADAVLQIATQSVAASDNVDANSVSAVNVSSANAVVTSSTDTCVSAASASTAPTATAAAKNEAEGSLEPAKPLKKSAGALALERLLSSNSSDFGAATSTPNIHKREVMSTKWLREDQKAKAAAKDTTKPSK